MPVKGASLRGAICRRKGASLRAKKVSEYFMILEALELTNRIDNFITIIILATNINYPQWEEQINRGALPIILVLNSITVFLPKSNIILLVFRNLPYRRTQHRKTNFIN